MKHSIFDHFRALKGGLLYVTDEEDRFFRRIAVEVSKPEVLEKVYVHVNGQGLKSYHTYLEDWGTKEAKPDAATAGIQDALTQIHQMECRSPHFFIILDAGRIFQETILTRRLLSLLQQIENVNQTALKTVILVSTSPTVPDTVARYIEVVPDTGPDDSEYQTAIRTWQQRTGIALSVPLSSLKGLAVTEVTALYKEAKFTKASGITAQTLFDYKVRRIKAAGVLDYINTEDFSFDQVGGLDRFKAWAEVTRHAWTEDGEEYGLQPPRGVLCIGIYGSGKSLSVKALGKAWGLPVLQMEMGKLRSSLVGDSERNLYRSLRFLEGLGKCILWVDEAEKSFAGMGSSDKSDSGTQARLIGILSTWLQESKAKVCLAMTANSLKGLPAEFTNRVDERFFFDVPHQEEREAILTVLFRKYRLAPESYQLYELGQAASGLVGREIEQAIKATKLNAFAEKPWSIPTQEGFVRELTRKPRIIETLKDDIAAIVDWVGYDPKIDDGIRARLASSKKKEPTFTVV